MRKIILSALAFFTMIPAAHATGANYVAGLKSMTVELTAFAQHYLQGLSAIFDGKQQLETEETLKRLTAQATKDYQPSDTMCRFGTFARSVANTEALGETHKKILDEALMNTYLNESGASSAESPDMYMYSRIEQFKARHCDPADSNGGLYSMCEHPNANHSQYNKDIDYTRTVDKKLTLDVNYLDPNVSPDEEDVYALAQHLYWTTPLTKISPANADRYGSLYLEARRLTAMQNVAHNSFANIVSLKVAADPANGADSGWNFMKALMKEFGLKDQEINQNLGNYPSYYAQMEVLTKKIYQNPSFYTNLYDKPANVGRISASMEAIKLMQGRDSYKSSLRREMLLSMMIENEIAERAKTLSSRIK